MKQSTLLFVITLFMFGSFVFAQTAGAQTESATVSEEAMGKIIWQKLQSKEIACSSVSPEDFTNLGEYFMGTMLGSSHEAMNDTLARAYGNDWLEQMHIAMGKRFSGCDTAASFPTENGRWRSMMGMMGGGPSPFGGFNNNATNNMMNFGYFGGLSVISMFLWWILIIAGIVALVMWAGRRSKGDNSHRSASAILKGRYARGEITKEQFEQMKKDLE